MIGIRELFVLSLQVFLPTQDFHKARVKGFVLSGTHNPIDSSEQS